MQVRVGLHIHRRGKQGVSRGEQGSPWREVSKGGQSPSLAHDFQGKSSVLYLCFRLTLERGWLRYLQHKADCS